MRADKVLAGALLAGLGFAVGTGTAVLRAQGTADEGRWQMQTRRYVTSGGKSWDAYLLNTETGELYFVNQDVRTLVIEGIAEGSTQPKE